jgi:metallo-beta-lactamase class B
MRHLILLRTVVAAIVLVMLGEAWSLAQSEDAPFPPHRVVGKVYYVGSKDLASYLITTGEGHVLINSGFEKTVPLIRASVEQLGFHFQDVEILLASHAHSDHVAGHALVKCQTAARVLVMEGDEELIRSGGKETFSTRPSSNLAP